jgi:hypothetical protein
VSDFYAGEVVQGTPLGIDTMVATLFGWTVLLSAVSMVVRFRRASGQERQQLKWLAAVGAVLLGFFVVDLFLSAWKGRLYDVVVFAVLASALYAAIGIAVLRHRLYDIDLLLNRTLVYGLLTVGGVGVYVGVVKSAEWLLREGVGWGGSLLATAVIAVGVRAGPGPAATLGRSAAVR